MCLVVVMVICGVRGEICKDQRQRQNTIKSQEYIVGKFLGWIKGLG